ncbi:hypothetical protein GCM10011514_14480 [Emticicia aquatilis]|uniref:Uncharacterized protein n=1 Tax=Emticicia aquatilis TaxID=1537369 RepID=A0A916YLC5_9BACT|nr:DUF3592 domain-containing protein [Emticicia aquatilis]GGD51355.1 hypothetical protein GCM10011514_14480 [Emticicia aquatilis]
MKYSELSKKTKLTIIVYSLLALMIGVFVIGFYIQKDNDKELLEKGERADASVVELYEQVTGTRKSKTYRYYMDVAFFTDAEKVKVLPKSDNIVDKIAAISEEAVANAKLGDYQSMRLSISQVSYQRHKKGDKVTVVYMKEEPTEAKLLEELQ